jgi:hypothetical protein
MRISKKSLVAVIALVAAASALVFALAANADHGRRGGDDDHGVRGKLFVTRLVGSVLADPAIHGVTRGGVPWDLKRGNATLDRDGRFKLRLRRLVIAGTDNPGGVTSVSASLFCAPDSSAAPAFTTGPVPLSSDGDARIKQHVALPARCLAPVVLVHPNGLATRYIAASGFAS